MCIFYMATEGRRLFIRSTVRLGNVDKWPLLMDWSKVLRIGLNSVAWYHCDRSRLVLADRKLSTDGCL